ncbi:MAG: FmdB family zinc ribbon protein [Steroidobacterales bacterium]
MPFYEYECQACKYYTEVMQKITDAPLTKCPSCGKRKLKKLVSAPVFRLKGAGWYETDFKGDKENKRNLVGADKEEVKSEAKPEAKEAKPDAKETKESKDSKDSKETKESRETQRSKAAPPKSSGAPGRSARRAGRTPPRKPKTPARKVARKGRR